MTGHVTLWRPRPGRVDRKHQDIPSGIHVTVKRETAVRTHMYANAQILLDDHTTPGARLRGVGRVHGHDLRTSFFRFVRKQLLELCQPRVMRAEGEVVIGRHKGEREVFEGNQRVGVGQLARELVPEVAALVGDALMQPGNLRGGFSAAGAAPLPASKAALGNTQLGKALAQPARVFDQRPVAERQQVAQSHVNPNRRAGVFQDYRVGQVEHQAGVPAMRPALDDHVLNRRIIRQRAVILDLDLAHVLDVEHHALAHPQLAPVSVPVFQAVEAVAPLEARKARRFTRFQAAEECDERLIEAAKHLLHAGCVELAERVGIGVAKVAEVRPLLVVAHALTRLFVDGDALFQRGVVERAPLPQQEVERPRLRLRRIQPIAVGANHALLSFLLVNVPLDCRGADVPGCTNIVRASPERGQATLEVRKLFPQLVAGRTFQPVHNLANCQRRRERSEQVNVVRHHNQVKHLTVKLLDVFGQQFGQAHANIPRQDWTPVFRTPDEVVVDVVGCVPSLFAHSNLIISREGKGGKRHSPPG